MTTHAHQTPPIAGVIARIRDWCGRHPTVLSAALWPRDETPVGSRFTCEIITAGEWHDTDLDGDLSDLDTELAARYDRLDVRVRSVPARFRASDRVADVHPGAVVCYEASPQRPRG